MLLIYLSCPSPATVDCKPLLLTYREVPRPATVDASPVLLIYLDWPKPATVDMSVLVSMPWTIGAPPDPPPPPVAIGIPLIVNPPFSKPISEKDTLPVSRICKNPDRILSATIALVVRLAAFTCVTFNSLVLIMPDSTW